MRGGAWGLKTMFSVVSVCPRRAVLSHSKLFQVKEKNTIWAGGVGGGGAVLTSFVLRRAGVDTGRFCAFMLQSNHLFPLLFEEAFHAATGRKNSKIEVINRKMSL